MLTLTRFLLCLLVYTCHMKAACEFFGFNSLSLNLWWPVWLWRWYAGKESVQALASGVWGCTPGSDLTSYGAGREHEQVDLNV